MNAKDSFSHPAARFASQIDRLSGANAAVQAFLQQEDRINNAFRNAELCARAMQEPLTRLQSSIDAVTRCTNDALELNARTDAAISNLLSSDQFAGALAGLQEFSKKLQSISQLPDWSGITLPVIPRVDTSSLHTPAIVRLDTPDEDEYELSEEFSEMISNAVVRAEPYLTEPEQAATSKSFLEIIRNRRLSLPGLLSSIYSLLSIILAMINLMPSPQLDALLEETRRGNQIQQESLIEQKEIHEMLYDLSDAYVILAEKVQLLEEQQSHQESPDSKANP